MRFDLIRSVQRFRDDCGHDVVGMSIEVGKTVELTAVENSELDLTGKRGTVIRINHQSGLAVVSIGGSEISVWPDNLKVVSSTAAGALQSE